MKNLSVVTEVNVFEPFAPHETDFYKVGHAPLYPNGTSFAYSNFTARACHQFERSNACSALYDKKLMVFGTTASVKEIHAKWKKTFFDAPKEKAIRRYKTRMDRSLGEGVVDVSLLEELHDMGYLPLAILSIDEGERIEMKIPLYVIYSTLPQFYWLVNYLETVLSSTLWKMVCNATIAFEFRRVFEKYAELTGSPRSFVYYQGHDFSYRGIPGTEAAARGNSGHLMVFKGTDTIPAIDYVEQYYGEKDSEDPIGESIVATEHAVATSNILTRMTEILEGRDLDAFSDEQLDKIRIDCELEYIVELITEKVPSGNVSLVCDSFDFFGILRNIGKIKQEIFSRRTNQYGQSRVVIRPDSGDPVLIVTGYRVAPKEYSSAADFATDIADPLDFSKRYDAVKINGEWFEFGTQYDGFDDEEPSLYVGRKLSREEVIGAIESLWETFGGTLNEKGYRVLCDRVGLIYGDSISVERQQKILERLMEKNFASCNIVLGIGSFTYQYNTRDTFGMAVKATAVNVRDRLIEIYKDPATGDKTKKSACGLLKVIKDENGEYQLLDRQEMTDIESESGELTLMYKNGQFFKNPSFVEIREKIDSNFI